MGMLQAVEILCVSDLNRLFVQLLGDACFSVPSGQGTSEELNKNCSILRLIQCLKGAHDKKNQKAHVEITGRKVKYGWVAEHGYICLKILV